MGILDRLFGDNSQRNQQRERQRKGFNEFLRQQGQELIESSEEAIARRLAGLESLDLAQAKEIDPASLSDAERWVLSGEWFSGFTSSNWVAIQYDLEEQTLYVEYKGSSFYAYRPVSEALALDCYNAPSKGVWGWDHLRVRGTVFGYQIPYEFLSGPSSARRQWMRTEETRRKHGQIGPTGKDFFGHPIRPKDIR